MDHKNMSPGKKKAVFLDRDGVINKNVPRLTKPDQFTLIPGAAEAIKKINRSGLLAVVVTNQPVIAKGFCTFEGMEKIHKRMNNLLAKECARIDAVYICPHHPEKGYKGEVASLKIECGCRKPLPGLFLQAEKELEIDLKRSWVVGDSYSDVAAGRRIGARTILLTSGGSSGGRNEEGLSEVKADYVLKNLSEAVKFILSRE